MRRLYSTFARGAPGLGLLLLRLVAGIAVIADGVTRLRSGQAAGNVGVHLFAMAAGILLVTGLWTPFAGSAVALFGIWGVISQMMGILAGVLLSAVGAALALLGPGVWSIDSRLFGWKRIDVSNRAR